MSIFVLRAILEAPTKLVHNAIRYASHVAQMLIFALPVIEPQLNLYYRIKLVWHLALMAFIQIPLVFAKFANPLAYFVHQNISVYHA